MASSHLHLRSFVIEGFRGIRSLELPQLGRVALLAGKNSVGKTTVLDAVRFYAARGDFGVLFALLNAREEYLAGPEDGGADVASLFHSQGVRDPTPIRIGGDEGDMWVRLAEPTHADQQPDSIVGPGDAKVLTVTMGTRSRTIPALSGFDHQRMRRTFQLRERQRRNSDAWPAPIRTETLGPGLLDNADLARLWDVVALTQGEELAVEALGLVLGEDVERLTVVGDGRRSYGPPRRALVKLTSSDDPVPLKRLGDGANRLLAVALALANCRDGILLIDEAENGIHYSVQADMWRMVFRAAEQANVQVVAATHSWDCVTGFAAAAIESESDGVLYRLEEVDGELYAVHYPEDELEVAARQRIEVR